MSMLDTVKGFLGGKTPTARLAEIETAIKAAETERDQHLARRPAAVVGKLTGDPDATARVEAIDEAVAAIDARLRDLRDGAGELRRQRSADEAAAKRAEAVARPRRQAELAADFIAADGELRMLFQDAGEKLREQMGRAAGLGSELGEHAGRAFNAIAWMTRFRSQLAHHFAGDFAEGMPNTMANNLLGLVSDVVGEAYFAEIDDVDQRLLDDLCPLFLTEDAAKAAQARIAERDRRARAAAAEAIARRPSGVPTPDLAPIAEGAVKTIVAKAGDVWTLIEHSALFASRPAAEEALRLSLVWRAGGYAVIGFQDGAAIVRADLAGIIAPIAPPARAA